MKQKQEAGEEGKSEAPKVSFLAKEEITCPACGAKLRREELFSGSGRLIAGELTDEMHRLYEKSAKYGVLYPLAYLATVCPECLFASMEKDFSALPEGARAAADAEKRKAEISLLISGADFHKPRNLVTGALSQYLVLRCYEYYPPAFSPTIKSGLAALRAGWLFDDLNREMPGQHYDWLSTLFKKKANFFYTEALKREVSGKETIAELRNSGPDTDKNYGYEGILYICALLEFKYGETADPRLRMQALAENNRNLAKMFGMGKSSKNKPGALLEKSRQLYETITKTLGEFDE